MGAATSRHLVPADDCNVTVIIEDTSLLPGYGDKQVSLPTEGITKKGDCAEQDAEYQNSICKVNIVHCILTKNPVVVPPSIFGQY